MVVDAKVPNSNSGSKSSDTRIVVTNALIDFVRHASVWGLNGVMVLFLPRYLGADGLGQLQFALSFVMLFSIGVNLGIKRFLIKEIARDNSVIDPLLGSANAIRLISATVVIGLIVLASQFLDMSTDGRVVIYVAAIWMVSQSFGELSAAVLYGMEEMAWPAIADVVGKIVVIVVGIVVLVSGYGVLAYVSVLAGGMFIRFAITAIYVKHRFTLGAPPDLKTMKKIVAGGMPFVMMGFLLTAYAHIDMVTVRILTSDTVVGWYAAAHQIFRTVEFIPVAVTTALLPTLSRLHRTNPAMLAYIAQKGISAALLLIVPLALGTSLIAADLIEILPYPDEFDNSIPLLQILALSIPVTGLLTIMGGVVIAVDRQKAWTIALGSTLLVNFILNLLLIGMMQERYGNGAIGAVIATIVSELFMVVIGVWLVPHAILNSDLFSKVLKICLATAVMSLAVYGSAQFGAPILLKIAIGMVSYAVMVMATRVISRHELEFLVQSVKNRKALPAQTALPEENK